MRALIWIVVALVVIAAVALVVVAARRRHRAAELRSRFGREYDRAVERAGSTRRAQAQLEDVARRRDRLTLTELEPAARARFDESWLAIQTRFVDEPGQAVTDADGLVTAVMRARGYPVEDFEERAWMLAADHGDVVDHYRRARAAHTRHLETGRADTENLRQAFVYYRLLYGVLTGRRGGETVSPATASSGAHAAEPATVGEPGLPPTDGAMAGRTRAGTDQLTDTHRAVADRAAGRAGAATDRTGAVPDSADRTAADRTAADRTAADRTADGGGAPADRSGADPVAVDRTAVEDGAGAGRVPTADRAAEDRAEADRAAAEAEAGARVPAGGSPRMGGYRTAAERVAAERAERVAAERDQDGA